MVSRRNNNRLKPAHGLATIQRKQPVEIKQKRHHDSFTKALNSGLICFSVGIVMGLPHSVSAETLASTVAPAGTAVHAYDISSGSLEAALDQFAKQAGINVTFNAPDVQGMAAHELKGSFTAQAGLNRLLAGSGLEAVPQAGGYAIRKSTTAANQPTILPPVNVTAHTITGPTDGYMAMKSYSATRTDTLLRDVPQSITVVTKDLIKDQNMLSMGDVVRYVPGVGISQGEGNRDAVIFRGNNSTGDFYVDGLRDDVQYFRDLYNIDRVEVLKGSNGMMFGRGGAGGVINRVTKEAGWTPITEISAQYGSFSQKRVTVDIGRAINEVAAFRLNAMYEHSNSFRNGVDLERGGVNPTFTIKPDAQTKIVVGGEYFTDNRVGDRGIPSFGTITSPTPVVDSGRPADTHRSTFFGDPNRSPNSVNVWALNSLIERAFDNGLTVRNRTRYASYDKFYQNVFSSGPATAQSATGMVPIQAYNDATQRDNIFNQTDFLYALNTGPIKHEFMAGVEYGRQVTDNFRNNGYFNNNFSNAGRTDPNVFFFNPISLTPLTFRPDPTGGNSGGTPTANNHSIVEVVGVYLQDQITLHPQLKAVLGIRYDNFDTKFRNNNNGQLLHTNDGLISPRAGLIYKPIETMSIYGNYSLSYVPRAGDQLTSLAPSTAALKPEQFMNLELGAKWDIRPDLALTAALYQLERNNVIAPVPNVVNQTMLVDGQRARGAEVGLMGRITPQWSVMGGYAYTDAEITRAITGAQAGAVVAQVPKHTVSMWNRYDFAPWLGLGLGVIHRSSMYAALDNTVLLPGFTRLDSAIFMRLNKTLRVQANIENIADIEYVASAHNNNNILPGAPRIYRLTVVANF